MTVQAQGDARHPPMLHALASSSGDEVRRKVRSAMLYQVKVPERRARNPVGRAGRGGGVRNERAPSRSAFWNAGLDDKEHLEEFVSCAIEGDAAECLECLTVIENQGDLAGEGRA